MNRSAALCQLILSLALAWAACTTAADEPPASFTLHIDSAPLEQALQEFARQSGRQILFFSQIAAGRRAPRLSGRFTLNEAMSRLLAGSGLSFRLVNEQTVEVRVAASPSNDRTAASESAPLDVRGGNDILDEVVVIGAAEQLAALRVPTPLLEIPQSISIISPEQIRQQSHASLSEVMHHAAGIVTSRTSSLAADYYSRGFKVLSFHIDGGAAINPRVYGSASFSSSPDLSEFEYVEVLRGSNALFTGNANPSGTVSLVRKRPSRTFQAELSATLGSWNNRRLEIDIAGPLTSSGRLRGRVDAVHASNDYFYDTANFERQRIFGVLDWDIVPSGTVTAGGSYQWDEALPWLGGIPSLSDGTDPRLPRSTALTFDWSFVRTRTSEVYAQYRHEFDDSWNLRFNSATWESSQQNATALWGLVDPETFGLAAPNVTFTVEPNIYRQDTADVTVTGEFDWFGMQQRVAIGADYTRFLSRVYLPQALGFGPGIADVRRFDPRGYPDPRLQPIASAPRYRSTVEQYGAFISLFVAFDERWSATAGVRVASDRTRVYTRGDVEGFGSSSVATPLFALMHRFGPHYSWYLSYADVYLTPSTSFRLEGGSIGPEHGGSVETGIKAAWRDGRLNGSFALYRITQRGVPVYNPTKSLSASRLYCCYDDGRIHSRGAEVQLDGELAAGWIVGGGYSYNEHGQAIRGQQDLVTPRHLVKLWSSLRLPARFARWSLGGDVEAQSGSTVTGEFWCAGGCDGFAIEQEAYAVLGLRAALQLNSQWEIALRIDNALDENYYEAASESSMHRAYGEPRNFTLRLDGKF